MSKRILAAVMLMVFVLISAACGKDSIFSDQKEVVTDYTVTSETKLLRGKYYIKDGTSFIPLNGGEDEEYTEPNPETIYIADFGHATDSIPVLYKDETICIKNADVSQVMSIGVMRYKDCGWTVGLTDLKKNDYVEYYDGMKSSLLPGSSIETAVNAHVSGDLFAIAAVDGVAPQVLQCGCIKGLEKDSIHTYTIYVGTEQTDIKAAADTHIYESSEYFVIDSPVMTDLGYMAFKMPEKAQTGIYMLNGAGLVRYVADRKTAEQEEYDWNIPNVFEGVTHSIDDTLEKTSDSRDIIVKEGALSLQLKIKYREDRVILDRAYIILPDGKKEEIKSEYDVTDPQIGKYVLCLEGYNPYDVICTPDIKYPDSEKIPQTSGGSTVPENIDFALSGVSEDFLNYIPDSQTFVDTVYEAALFVESGAKSGKFNKWTRQGQAVQFQIELPYGNILNGTYDMDADTYTFTDTNDEFIYSTAQDTGENVPFDESTATY